MLAFFQAALHTVKSAPADVIKSIALEGSSAPIDISFIGLILQADGVVKLVMFLLALASIWSWTIIFEKWFLVKSVKAKTKTFEKTFWASSSLENLYERVKGRESHPIANIFISAMQEWQSRNAREMVANNELKAGTKQRIYQAMQVAINRSLDDLEKNLTFLATVGSSAPFIGLFGTVWGIMVSFQSIAISNNTTLAVVAPGIAEALLATAFGLVAAIPAVIFYNKYTSDSNEIATTLDDFSNELGSIITKEIDHLR